MFKTTKTTTLMICLGLSTGVFSAENNGKSHQQAIKEITGMYTLFAENIAPIDDQVVMLTIHSDGNYVFYDSGLDLNPLSATVTRDSDPVLGRYKITNVTKDEIRMKISDRFLVSDPDELFYFGKCIEGCFGLDVGEFIFNRNTKELTANVLVTWVDKDDNLVPSVFGNSVGPVSLAFEKRDVEDEHALANSLGLTVPGQN